MVIEEEEGGQPTDEAEGGGGDRGHFGAEEEREGTIVEGGAMDVVMEGGQAEQGGDEMQEAGGDAQGGEGETGGEQLGGGQIDPPSKGKTSYSLGLESDKKMDFNLVYSNFSQCLSLE